MHREFLIQGFLVVPTKLFSIADQTEEEKDEQH